MDVTERESLLARYEEGPALVEAAVVAVGPDGLDRRPAPGEWSGREVVHHLADSEMTSAIRLRRLLAEDDPVITGYDEEELARRLHYDRPVDASLALLRAVRGATAEILHRLDEADWTRCGTHTESGPYGVEAWLRIYADHAHDHAGQLRRAGGLTA